MPATSVQAAAATAALAQLPLVLGMPTWNGYSENGWLKKEATRNGSHDPLMLLGGVAAASAPAQNGDGSKHGRWDGQRLQQYKNQRAVKRAVKCVVTRGRIP